LVHCSKGTYIRSLAEDIGAALAVGGYVSALRRVQAGPFDESQALDFETLQPLRDREAFDELDALLLPLDTALSHIPAARLGEVAAGFLRNGQAVFVPQLPAGELFRLYETTPSGPVFMGLGELLADGRITPRRLLANM